jgi:lipoprotein signal peptidase
MNGFYRVLKVIVVIQVFQVHRKKMIPLKFYFHLTYLGSPGAGFSGEKGQKGEPVSMNIKIKPYFFNIHTGIICSLYASTSR